MNNELPKVTKSMASIAAIETGCCLRSCGGSPAPLTTAKKNDNAEILKEFMN